MTNTTATIAHFLGFTALLRRSGFAVAPEQSMAWLTAIELLGPSEMEDIRRAARATLAPPPERFADFDALFDAHFLGSIVPGLEEGEPSDEEPLRAAEDGAIGPEPEFGDETHEFRRRGHKRRAAFGAAFFRGRGHAHAAPIRPRAAELFAAAARLSLALSAHRHRFRHAADVSRCHA